MTYRKNTLRALLNCGAAAIALGAFTASAQAEDEAVAAETSNPSAVPVQTQILAQAPNQTQSDGPNAHAQMIEERQSYALRLMTQIYDGERDLSHTQLMGVGRVRKGNRSFTQYDYGDGAVVIDKGEKLAAGRFLNTSQTEKAVLYNYDTKTLSGDRELARLHNDVVRPLLDKGPALGSNVAWSQTVPLSALRIPGMESGDIVIELSREYFTHDGKPMVLVHYKIPAFGYDARTGQKVVQWAHGISLTDPGFGMVYLNAALHRAVASDGGAVGVPYRYARTMVAADDDGSALIDYRDVPQLAPYLDDLFSTEAMRVIPPMGNPLSPGKQPVDVARVLDVVALSIAENGANNAPNTTAAQSEGSNDSRAGALLGATVTYFSKLSAASKGIVSFDEYVKAVGDDLGYYTKALETLANKNIDGYLDLRDNLTSLDKRSKGLTLLLQKEIDKIDVIDDLNESKVDKLLGLLDNIDDQTDAVKAQMRLLDQEATTIARVRAQVQAQSGAILGKLNSISSNPKVVKFAEGFSDLTGKLEGPLGFLDGVFTVSEVYTNASSLGHFDPADKDLQLTGNYDSAAGFVSDIALNMMGILGNAAQGNVVATVSDTLAFASGRFTDLYKAIEGAEHARRQSKQAHMEYILTLKKQTRDLTEAEAKALEELRKNPTGLYTEEDPYTEGYNLNDPRIDENTGLPKSPEFWQWLKDNDPQFLVNLGIDPEAPVGGWPGGVGPEHRPRDSSGQPEDPPVFDINDGEDYPTAPERDPDATQDGGNDDMPPPSELSPEQLRAIEIEQRRQEAQDRLDAHQKEKLAQRDAEEAERAKQPGTNEFRTTALETSELLVSEFDMDPVVWTPVTMDPATFDKDNDLFDEDGNLKKVGPDDFVMTPFDPPEVSRFPPTDPDDLDGYPGTGEYPAYGFESMSGISPDLEKWAEWLATQDIRKLEQLAIAAGYPTLAWALADAERIIRDSQNEGFRTYANRGPNCAGYTGCVGSIGPWKLAYATVRLGDILAGSREIFSTGGFSDIGISGFNLMYMLRDFGIQDGDLIDVEISQFGRTIFQLRGHFLLTAGSNFNVNLRPGVAQMVISALNEGSASPNTAEVTIENVVRGDGVQTYSLETGQTATLRIEANAKADPSQGGQP